MMHATKLKFSKYEIRAIAENIESRRKKIEKPLNPNEIYN